MYIFCIIMICVASILLILAVLVQSPKSGMAANFGAANQTMGVRQTTDFLEKFTWAMVAAVVFFSLLSTTALPSSVKLDKEDTTEEALSGVEFAEEETAEEGTMVLDGDQTITLDPSTLNLDGVTIEPVVESESEPVAAEQQSAEGATEESDQQ